MSDATNDKSATGFRAHPLTPEAAPAPAPVPSTEDEAPVEGVGKSVAQVLQAVPGQYWGVDTSYDSVTLDEARRLFNAGVRVAFQCIWTGNERPGPAVANIKSYHDAGLITCGYLSVSPGLSGLAHVIQGYDTLPQDTKGFLNDVAIDVELTGLKYDFHVRPAIEAMAAKGYRRMAYTSYNAWKNLLGDPTPPQGTLLWNAFWDNDPDFDFASYPYGGGAFVLIGEQFTGGEDVEGVFADRSLFADWAFPVPTPEPVPEPVGSIRDVAFICDYITTCIVQGLPVALSPVDLATLKDYVASL